jgi:hypothetical protein
MNVRLEAMVFVISRSVSQELQPCAVVLAFMVRSVLPWTEILGPPEEEILDLLAAGQGELNLGLPAGTSPPGAAGDHLAADGTPAGRPGPCL